MPGEVKYPALALEYVVWSILEYTSKERRPSREIKQIHWKEHIVSSQDVGRLPQATEKYFVSIIR